VLQGVEAEVHEVRGVRMVHDAEHTTLIVEFVEHASPGVVDNRKDVRF
jgi:hypothetical protein